MQPKTATGSNGGRPEIMSRRAVISTGHHLATQIGLDVLKRGGNAMDAAAAAAFAIMVLQPHQNGMAGEAPILIYSARERRVRSISGHGVAPRAATLKHFRELGVNLMPGDGFLPAITPSAVAGWILLLRKYGTRKLPALIEPAIELAREGFPADDSLINAISSSAKRFISEWPTSRDAFLPGGAPPAQGALFKQPDLADSLQRLSDAAGKHGGRVKGLQAAHEEFYCGETARRIMNFVRKTEVLDASGKAHRGLLSMEDFRSYEARIEEPLGVDYAGLRVFKCGPWTQGPAMLQSLKILSNFDLAAMGFNSADYIHTVIESQKLAYADREYYYGDPRFVDVPFDRLLSSEYAAERAKLIDPVRASLDLRPGGYPAVSCESISGVEAAFAGAGHHIGDTTKLEVIDGEGNVVSATPSGGWLMTSPVIPGLGFPLGTRGQMFSLVEGHPNALAPGKRPRTSLTPTLALIGDRPYMAFGSPGGDCQDQWALLFFLNVTIFGMTLQAATEAPTFWTSHFPASFYPRRAQPGSLHVEARIDSNVIAELGSRGHRVNVEKEWGGGNTLAAAIDPNTGIRRAAASPRYEPAYAAGLW